MIKWTLAIRILIGVTRQTSIDVLQPKITLWHQMFHQVNSKELFRLCSLDLKMSSMVQSTNISVETWKNVLSAIHVHFSLGQTSNICFKNRSLFHAHMPKPHHSSPFLCPQRKLMFSCQLSNVNKMISKSRNTADALRWNCWQGKQATHCGKSHPFGNLSWYPLWALGGGSESRFSHLL